jgi:hypothetical protein
MMTIMNRKPTVALILSSKPTDGPSCGRTIGFVAHKAKGRWARGVVQQAERLQSARACLGWRTIAPAKGQAGAGRFVAGQICQNGKCLRQSGSLPLSIMMTGERS